MDCMYVHKEYRKVASRSTSHFGLFSCFASKILFLIATLNFAKLQVLSLESSWLVLVCSMYCVFDLSYCKVSARLLCKSCFP